MESHETGSVFANLGKELSATTNAEAAAEIILRAADVLLGWDACYIVLYDPEKSDRTRPLLTMDIIDGVRKNMPYDTLAKPSVNMIKAIRDDGFLSLYDEYFEVEPSQTFGDRSKRTLSQLFAPVKSGARVIGILSIQSYAKNAYDDFSLEIFKALCNHCAGALERIWAQELATSLSERRNILYKATQEISASMGIEQVFRAIHKAVEQVMPSDDWIIDEYNESDNTIVPLYIIVSGQGRIEDAAVYYADHGLSGAVVKTGKSFLFNTVEEINKSGIQFELVGEEEETQSIVAVPLLLRGKTTGMISAQSYTPNAYTQDDVELLEMLAAQAAIAMENARLFARVQEMANTDPLTGLQTRRKFYELAEPQFIRAKEQGVALSMILLDADNFKKINDKFGHKAGDIILQILAGELKTGIRERDILCRFGGEEFVIALPDTHAQAAFEIAERLRVAIEGANLKDAGKFQESGGGKPVKPLRATASFGVAEFNPICEHIDELIDKADKAMYAAKKAGKNCVVVGKW